MSVKCSDKTLKVAAPAHHTASAFLDEKRYQRLFLDFNASAPASGLEERRWPNETRQRRRHEGGPSRHARRLGRRRRSPAPRPHRALRRSSCARTRSDHSRRAPGRPGRAAAGAQPLPLRIPDPPRVARSTHSRLIFFFERRRLRGLHLGGPGGPDARVTHENFDGRCCAGGPAPILSARPGPGGRLGSSRFRPLDVSAAAKPDAVLRSVASPTDA